jgi:hypothetical protein
MGGDSRQAANMQKIHVVTERLFWIFDDPPQKPGRMLWQLWQGIIGLLEMGIPNQKGEQLKNHVSVIQRQSHDTSSI